MRKLLFLFSFIIFLAFPPASSWGAESSFSLSPSKNTYTVNQSFIIDIILSTGGGRVSAADIYFTFDKDKLRLEEIKEGKIFDQYLGREIDNFLGKGAISGIVNSTERLYKGTGTFASLKFKALKTGTASVVFKYTSGSKNDSNIADFDQKSDTLTKVENGLYIIVGQEEKKEDKIQNLENTKELAKITDIQIPETINDNNGQVKGIEDENNALNAITNNPPTAKNGSFPVIIIGILGVALLGAGAFFFYRFKSSRY